MLLLFCVNMSKAQNRFWDLGGFSSLSPEATADLSPLTVMICRPVGEVAGRVSSRTWTAMR